MRIKEFFIGRKILQPVFERIFRMSIRGMNYGQGGMLSTSGELNLIKLVASYLRSLYHDDKLVVLDVGANDGNYTALLIDNIKGSHEFHCFEPSQYSFKTLESRYLNLDDVNLLNFGLGSVSEKRKLFYDSEGSGWASVYERSDTGFNHVLNSSEKIEIVTLDEYCEEKRIDRIHFMKIDIEGFELEVFKGGERILPSIDFIQFEFSFANFNSKTYLFDFFEILKEFNIYRVLKDGVYPIKYDPRYEIFMTSNYLAVNNRLKVKF